MEREIKKRLFFFSLREIRRRAFLLVFYDLIFFPSSHMTAILKPIYNHWQVWIGSVTVFTPDQWWVIGVSWPVYPDITMEIRSSVSAGNWRIFLQTDSVNVVAVPIQCAYESSEADKAVKLFMDGIWLWAVQICWCFLFFFSIDCGCVSEERWKEKDLRGLLSFQVVLSLSLSLYFYNKPQNMNFENSTCILSCLALVIEFLVR